MLIEDNPGDARLIKEMFAEPGISRFSLEWVDRLSRGISYLKSNAADIVLLDLSLPDSRGPETFKKLVNQAPATPVIVLTGTDDLQLAIESLRSGVQDYLIKGRVSGDLLARSIMHAIERKRLEEELRAAHDNLERRVAQRTKELSASNRALREEIAQREKAEADLLESKARADLYVDLMSHDIANMNQVIIGFQELARENVAGDADTEELIGSTIDKVMASSRLIDNVKKLRRVTAGGGPRYSVDLGPLLEEIAGQYANVTGREVTVRYSPARGCQVVADVFLADVFTNLVDNAIKHSTGPLVIDIGLSQVSDGGKPFYKVTVEDNGPGITEERKSKIFNRFQRGKIYAERGSGIGLCLVKTLVEDYCGAVWVEDRVPGDRQKGSRFVVLLPVAEP